MRIWSLQCQPERLHHLFIENDLGSDLLCQELIETYLITGGHFAIVSVRYNVQALNSCTLCWF